ncbi:50S small subunit ribosomal protein L28e [Cryptococcus wingfieldii CBS 7118]|uniref:50S small subunit ribosomal protein L28e n=1 Tax=Cryptococcus wingfieldii CBS 7118 TaxID=1295528 RepID=A0A1E3IIS1_9TREE|nr:50S small subunit ribosomal protein L28e [Cryptococcus wingfieldii CBS 7118]ODN88428.1 50S small subunit ribosomal protein L28e [Cryptococcus wingfieldii CBS 7118]
MSADLTWLLLRNYNSFQVKGGHGPTFSKEKGNLLNKSSQKYSGLANSKVVAVAASPNGGVTITKIKADAKPNQVASARSHVALKRSTGPRRANKIVAGETAGKGYRADLRAVAVARTSALLLAQRRTANPPKTIQRGRKQAPSAVGKAAAEEEVEEIVVDVE